MNSCNPFRGVYNVHRLINKHDHYHGTYLMCSDSFPPLYEFSWASLVQTKHAKQLRLSCCTLGSTSPPAPPVFIQVCLFPLLIFQTEL